MKRLYIMKVGIILLLVIIFSTTCGKSNTQYIQGIDGKSSLVVVSRFEDSNPVCESGSGIIVRTGLDDNSNATLDSEEITNISYVCDGLDGSNGLDGVNGIDGTDGTNGQNGTSYDISLIDPCGKQSDYDEIIIKINSEFISFFIDKKKYQFITVLVPGNYVTTDSTGCEFEITEDFQFLEK